MHDAKVRLNKNWFRVGGKPFLAGGILQHSQQRFLSHDLSFGRIKRDDLSESAFPCNKVCVCVGVCVCDCVSVVSV